MKAASLLTWKVQLSLVNKVRTMKECMRKMSKLVISFVMYILIDMYPTKSDKSLASQGCLCLLKNTYCAF